MPDAPPQVAPDGSGSTPSAPVQIAANGSSSSPSAPVQIAANGSSSSPDAPPVVASNVLVVDSGLLLAGASPAWVNGVLPQVEDRNGRNCWERVDGARSVTVFMDPEFETPPTARWNIYALDTDAELFYNWNSGAQDITAVEPPDVISWAAGDPNPPTVDAASGPVGPPQVAADASSSPPAAPPAIV